MLGFYVSPTAKVIRRRAVNRTDPDLMMMHNDLGLTEAEIRCAFDEIDDNRKIIFVKSS